MLTFHNFSLSWLLAWVLTTTQLRFNYLMNAASVGHMAARKCAPNYTVLRLTNNSQWKQIARSIFGRGYETLRFVTPKLRVCVCRSVYYVAQV